MPDALDSALTQTRQPNEVIVVDDGSTDDTAKVALSYHHVNYLFQKNRGLSAARNGGLKKASGEYVLFLDADDMLMPDAIELCLSSFAENPSAAFVYGGFWYVGEKREFISEVLPEYNRDHFAGLLRRNHIGMHGTVMYNTTILRGIDGFDETLNCCEDYDVYLRLAKDYPLGMYLGISAQYRQHNESMSRDAPKMLKGVLSVLNKQSRIAQSSREWRFAYAEGQRTCRDLYGEQIIDQLAIELKGRRRVGTIRSLVLAGLIYDRGFLKRLTSRINMRVWRGRPPRTV